LATDRVDLGSPGVGWLYSRVVLGEVRVRVAPVSPGSAVFVGIGTSTDVDRYLAAVSHTLDPANGSWTVVVMNADGRPGIDVVDPELGPGCRPCRGSPSAGWWEAGSSDRRCAPDRRCDSPQPASRTRTR
jgi:hypothetical protein